MITAILVKSVKHYFYRKNFLIDQTVIRLAKHFEFKINKRVIFRPVQKTGRNTQRFCKFRFLKSFIFCRSKKNKKLLADSQQLKVFNLI
jgi:hypothetical protein